MPNRLGTLIKAQKAWLVYRDADYEAARQYCFIQDGTIWPGLYQSFRTDVVRDRVMRLRELTLFSD
jgi:uncharacterized protein YecT (DUF1311 family)